MPILKLYGHEESRARLAPMIRAGTLPASLLFHGPRGVGKQRLALWTAQFLLCASPSETGPCGTCQGCRYAAELAHPDVHWFFPRPRLKDSDPSRDEVLGDFVEARAERVKRGGLYSQPSGSDGIFISTVGLIVHLASLTPAMGQRTVIIIGDAERMVPQEGSEYAANAFLKLLEEPPRHVRLLLTTSEPGALLPTVRSRLVAMRVRPVSEQAMGEFLADPAVVQAVADEGDSAPQSIGERIRQAAGAPGALLGGADRAASWTAAKRLLDAATSHDRVRILATAASQGAVKARGAFADSLDALATMLHDRVSTAVHRSDEPAADAACRAILMIEDAKGQAARNATPSLITAALLRHMSEVL